MRKGMAHENFDQVMELTCVSALEKIILLALLPGKCCFADGMLLLAAIGHILTESASAEIQSLQKLLLHNHQCHSASARSYQQSTYHLDSTILVLPFPPLFWMLSD